MSDDIFEALHNSERTFISEGHADGVRDGMASGIAEGRELGVQKGYDIGMEVGYYAGCVGAWRQLQQLDAAAIPARAERGIVAMEELLAAFPLNNPQDERMQELLESLQGRFKAVTATLGVLHDYLPKVAGPVSYAF